MKFTIDIDNGAGLPGHIPVNIIMMNFLSPSGLWKA